MASSPETVTFAALEEDLRYVKPGTTVKARVTATDINGDSLPLTAYEVVVFHFRNGETTRSAASGSEVLSVPVDGLVDIPVLADDPACCNPSDVIARGSCCYISLDAQVRRRADNSYMADPICVPRANSRAGVYLELHEMSSTETTKTFAAQWSSLGNTVAPPAAATVLVSAYQRVVRLHAHPALLRAPGAPPRAHRAHRSRPSLRRCTRAPRT